MGIYYSVYVGPYVECVTHKTDIEDIKYSCPTYGCRTYTLKPDFKFCSVCGGKVGEQKYLRKTNAVEFHNLDLADDLYPIHNWYETLIDTLIPNRSFLNRDSTFNLTHIVLPIKEEMIGQELNLFEKTFETELQTLKENYDTIIVKWGIIMNGS